MHIRARLAILAFFALILSSIAFTAACPAPYTASGTYTMSDNYEGAPNNASPLKNTSCVEIAASNIIFDCNGFNITNNGTAGTTYGILLNGSLTNVTVKNCNVANFSYGIYSYRSNSSTYSNNSAFFNSQIGFDLNTSSNNSLTNNIAFNNTLSGFYIGNSSRNNSLASNSAYNNTQHGFFIDSACDNNSLASNSAYRNGQNGFYLRTSSNNSVSNNIAYNNAVNGFYLYLSSRNNSLASNSAYNNTQHGFFFESTANGNIITNNSAYNNTQHGIHLSGASYNRVADNRVFNNTQRGLSVFSSSTNNTLINNTATTNLRFGFYLETSSGNTFINNSIITARGQQGFLMVATSLVNFQNNITESNTINGLPMYFRSNQFGGCPTTVNLGSSYSWFGLVNCSDADITGTPSNAMDYGLLAYTNRTNVTGAYVTGTPTGYSFYAYFSPFTRIEDSISSINSRGFNFVSSPNGTLINNTANESVRAFNFENSSGFALTGDTAYNCSSTGFYFDISSFGSIINSTANKTGGFGIYVKSSSNISLIGNTASNHTNSGIIMDTNTSFNNITGNTVYNNMFGFSFSASLSNSVTNNSAVNNSQYGFLITSGSNSSRFEENTGYNNSIAGFFLQTTSSRNLFRFNSVYNNGQFGFNIEAVTYNNFTNNSVFNNLQHGFYLKTSATNNLFFNNTAYNNTQNGFYLDSSPNNTLTDNSAYGNLQYGLYIQNSNATNVTNLHLFSNNASDIYIRTDATARRVYLTNITFDNPAGDMQNYTRISITDTIEANKGYKINWTAFTGSMPSGRASFAQKFVNISNTTTSVSIDSITFLWTDGEAAASGDDDLRFELWKYNSTWSNANAALNTTSNSLTLTNMNPASIYGILKNTENCPIITESGTYEQNFSFIGSPNSASPQTGTACVKIAASDVVFDCNGFSITNNGTTGTTSGILLNGSLTNVTVKNCNVANYNNSIFSSQSNSSNFTNNTAYNGTYGLYLSSSSNNHVSGNRLLNNSNFGMYFVSSTNNYVINNLASGNPQRGAQITTGSNNNTFAGNAFSGAIRGIVITLSVDNALINNTAYNNSGYGFFINSANNTDLIGNTAYNMIQYGFGIINSNATNATDTHLFNNSFADFYAVTDGTVRIVYLNNLTFDNPNGDMQNYTSISISDILEASKGYRINWSASPGSLPDNYTAFAQKFVDISNTTSAVSIDSISFSWTDAEAAAGSHNETRFALWKYNSSGWADMNATLNTSSNTLTLTSLNPASIYGILENNASSDCPGINAPGEYIQTRNYFGAPNNASPLGGFACIKIASSDVVFDCMGYNITYDGSQGSNTTYGILLNGSLSNVTVKNCPGISNYTHGAYLYYSNNSLIQNVTALNNSQTGFSLAYGSDNVLLGDAAYDNAGYGFFVSGGMSPETTERNNISNCISSGGDYGFYIGPSSSGRLVNNTASEGQWGFYLSWAMGDNSFNLLERNQASLNSRSGFYLYRSESDTLLNNTAFSNNHSGFEQTQGGNCTYINNTAYSNNDSGFLITDSANSTFSLNTAYLNTENGFYADNSPNITFACGTVHDNPGFGIRADSNSDNTSVIGNSVRNSSTGISVSLSDSANVSGNLVYDSSYGISLGSGAYHELSDNLAERNGRGISLSQVSDSIARNNTAYNNTADGFFLSLASYLTFSGTISKNNSANGFYLGGSNLNSFTGTETYGNQMAGFNISGSDNQDFTDISSYSNGRAIYMLDSDNNTFSNLTAHSNGYAIYLEDSDNASITDAHIYGSSSRDVLMYAHTANTDIRLSNMTIDNPLGSMINYTVIDLEDSMGAPEAYSISWSSAPAALPDPNHLSFDSKYLNISVITSLGTFYIDNITFRWDDSELTGHNESAFELWKYNASGWNQTGATLDTSANSLNLQHHNPRSIYGILENVSLPANCMAINLPGSYTMTTDFEGAPNTNPPINCVSILAADVIFDCAGHKITNNGTTGKTYGIYMDSSNSNVSIRNCDVSGYSYGIYVDGVSDVKLIGNHLHNNSYAGGYFNASNNINISQAHFSDNNETDMVFDASMAFAINVDRATISSPNGWDTTLSISDSLLAGEKYTIFGSDPIAALPDGFMAFHNEFINITPSGSPSIDSISWHLNNYAGFDLEKIGIYKNNGSGWVDMNATLAGTTFTLTDMHSFSNYGPLSNGTAIALGMTGANVTAGNQTRWAGMNASNVTTEGGNVTDLGINMTSVTDRWAAFYGNVTGSLSLKESGLPAYAVYEWAWNASDNGGFVCVAENPAYNFITIEGATPNEIDTAWGFDSYSDNALNTFTNGSCTIDLAASTATATQRAKTGDGATNDPFYTCPLKSPTSTSISPGDQLKFAFCSPIMGPSGYNWKSENINFEMIVPTVSGSGTETYYFFAQLY